MSDVKISKFMSLVLRHDPDKLGIALDSEGWTDFDEFATRMNAKFGVAELDLRRIVETNDKKRFVIRDGRIRASQGHSIDVDLNLSPISPPDLLYHGTTNSAAESIAFQGLLKGARTHVHLSADPSTAERVATRRKAPWVVFEIAAQEMHRAGSEFYRSENLVWLVDRVPPRYLRIIKAWGES